MNREVDRRTFLKILGATAVAMAGGLPIIDTLSAHTAGSDSITTAFYEHLETGTLFQDPKVLKRNVEDQFGVVILPGEKPEEIAEKFNIDAEMVKKTMVLRTDWDAPRLWAIYSTLAILPKQFYASRKLGDEQQPLSFSLFEYTPVFRSAASYFLLNHEVQLGRADFRQTIFEQLPSKKRLVHELTHSITSLVYAFRNSEQQLKDLVQLHTTDELRQAFTSIITEDDTDLKPYRIKSWRTHIGYGASNFDEFWSVAAEYYIDGKSTFVREYTPYLGPERTERFYKGLREILFEEREYKAGVLLTNS